MSTKIDGTKIYMTRGDTPTLNFKAYINATGDQYEPDAGDQMFFRMCSVWDDTPVLEKTLTNGRITLDVNDTKSLPYGEYFYCVELVTANGYHDTFIEPSMDEGYFEIKLEVEQHG